jgi:DtxR family Mn-dependent transcriptional regulator
VSSVSREDYLLAVYRLQKDASPVSTTAIADLLGVTPASVTGMIRKLHVQGLLEHEPYRGVVFTPEGERQALHLLRRHRLWELFLTEVLALPWDQVHEEAHRLEHATSDRVTERLASFLGEPESDPHGQQIPACNGALPTRMAAPLSGAQVGQLVTVVEVPDTDQALLRRLGTLGLYPGQSLSVDEVAPVNGSLTVSVGGTQHTLSREVAGKLLVSGSGDNREVPDE